MKRVLILADESNISLSGRRAGLRVDWLELRQYLTNPDAYRAPEHFPSRKLYPLQERISYSNRELIDMVLFCGLAPTNMPQQRRDKEGFLFWATTQGFNLYVKEGIPTQVTDTSYKANIDVDMAVIGMQMVTDAKPDVVVLATGDNDFAVMARSLRMRGIRVEVAASESSLGGDLARAANQVLPLDPAIVTQEAFDKRYPAIRST